MKKIHWVHEPSGTIVGESFLEEDFLEEMKFRDYLGDKIDNMGWIRILIEKFRWRRFRKKYVLK